MPIPTRPFVGTPDRGTAFPVLGDVKSIRAAVAFTSPIIARIVLLLPG